MPPKILAIGSSTGGPQALLSLFEQLKNRIKLPILITQHMPPNFTAILAEHLGRASGMPAAEAVQGEIIVPGRIYIAPGDWHMRVVGTSGVPQIALDQNERENYCRPAVDPMLRSIANVYGDRVLPS
jgi:two-component system chemotaxis response regulator CheB